MSNIERMRAAAANKPPAAPKSPPGPPKQPAKPKPAAPVKPPPVKVQYRCKCSITVAALGMMDCPAHRRKARAAAAARRCGDGGARWVPPVRLPDGSVKVAVYDAGKQQWRGLLRIPLVPELFTARADTETACLRALHTAWFLWRQSHPEWVPPFPPGESS